MSLTPRQLRFVEEYLKDLSGKEAAIRAGFSRHSAKDQASQMLANSEIAAAVDDAKIARSQRTAIDSDWVLQRLAGEATADLADLYADNGSILPVEEWPLVWRQGLVAGIEVEELYEGKGEDRKQVGIVRKLRLSDRMRRLEMIGKHVAVNAFQDVVSSKDLSSLAERLERAQVRVPGHKSDDGG
ncbi:terminase small subunit [Rhizobium leguminosarum]|uniref:terminase small subunit n=1 Tax=Rhizobium leguminosarum TaxID=384 RepID=UPI00102F368A|nr:terminase small subunit [Rhizobium leguminosarum]TAU22555.1 terminase small subunit [Rhizobium leguminosarum]TAU42551.1 terminase small subunit [Rhizobium leguminosarum]